MRINGKYVPTIEHLKRAAMGAVKGVAMGGVAGAAAKAALGLSKGIKAGNMERTARNEQLDKLARQRTGGVMTENEYQKRKARIK